MFLPFFWFIVMFVCLFVNDDHFGSEPGPTWRKQSTFGIFQLDVMSNEPQAVRTIEQWKKSWLFRGFVEDCIGTTQLCGDYSKPL